MSAASPEKTPRVDCVAVGAGIGGLAFALSRARFGRSTLVLESAKQLGEVGAGISLPPNALKLLWRLGLKAELEQHISVPRHGEIRRGDSGELLAEVPFGDSLVARYGAPFAQIHRADLHQLLLQAVEATGLVDIRTNAEVTGCATDSDTATLTLASGESLSADAVIACDGIRSAVRTAVFDTAPPHFTRHVAWRCLIPLHQLPSHLRERRSVVSLMDHRQLVHYPVRDMSLMNCVAFVGEMDWSIESWTERGDVDELKTFFNEFRDDAQAILDAVPRNACHRWAIYDREPIQKWVEGRVALLGDAAHPMPPYLGQGAAMAIEDAFVLATQLDDCADVDRAFSRYAMQRIGRANGALEESRAAGRRFQEPGADVSRFDNDQAIRADRMFGYEPDSPLPVH